MKDLADKYCGVEKMTAKQLQDQRNAEYFERVRLGFVDDNPPMPVDFRPVLFGVGNKLYD